MTRFQLMICFSKAFTPEAITYDTNTSVVFPVIFLAISSNDWHEYLTAVHSHRESKLFFFNKLFILFDPKVSNQICFCLPANYNTFSFIFTV